MAQGLTPALVSRTLVARTHRERERVSPRAAVGYGMHGCGVQIADTAPSEDAADICWLASAGKTCDAYMHGSTSAQAASKAGIAVGGRGAETHATRRVRRCVRARIRTGVVGIGLRWDQDGTRRAAIGRRSVRPAVVASAHIGDADAARARAPFAAIHAEAPEIAVQQDLGAFRGGREDAPHHKTIAEAVSSACGWVRRIANWVERADDEQDRAVVRAALDAELADRARSVLADDAASRELGMRVVCRRFCVAGAEHDDVRTESLACHADGSAHVQHRRRRAAHRSEAHDENGQCCANCEVLIETARIHDSK